VGRRSLILAISAGAIVAAWSASAIVAGVVAILRDSTYLKDVMIPSLLIAAVICSFSLRLTRRWWRRLKGSTVDSRLSQFSRGPAFGNDPDDIAERDPSTVRHR
jgi:steroid 5-alpha reductase family enzyme